MRSPRAGLLMLCAVAAVIAGLWQMRSAGQAPSALASTESLFQQRISGEMVQINAQVERLLADDNEGSRHQKFIAREPSGLTLLISHNIDLAPRVPVQVGDQIIVRGQYEWNERGGVIHWTHHDPQGRREGGWIKHREKIHQ